jgi:hypothetical protein
VAVISAATLQLAAKPRPLGLESLVTKKGFKNSFASLEKERVD